jgi:nitrogen fixation/metabolism regulation signal transduction histidine kinase
MPIYVKWLLFILVFAFLFTIFLWWRTRKQSRFQGRLALFFFLFVIIPLTPLSIFLGQLVIKSTETFMIPGVEESLVQSLDAFRKQLNDKGQHYLQSHENILEISTEQLALDSILYVGQFVQYDSLFILQTFQSTAADISAGTDSIPMLQAEQYIRLGQSISLDTNDVFESFMLKDSTLLMVAFQVPQYIFDAKNNITSSLRNYTTISLLQETMVEENVFWFVIFIFILFTAVVSVLLARLVSSGISDPIIKLIEGMRIIGSGDLSFRVQAKAKDEVAYLIDSFNNMAEELKISRENLQRAERAAAWRDIARQVSHEIKNPLTPIEFSIYRLESSLPPEWSQNADFSESLRMIKEEIAAIRRITDTFSKFAKMPHAEFKSMDVSEVVRSSADLFRNDSSGIPIQFQAEAELPPVQIDEQQIRGVLHNLIKNAIEACEADGRVAVCVSNSDKAKHRVKIDVQDNGSGMDEGTLKRIFDPYFTTKDDGSGIGLFLAKRIITDHGGALEVHSEPGEGTTFTILL